MTINKRTLLVCNLLYCYIPTILFLIGWVRWYYSIPISIGLLFLIITLCKRTSVKEKKTIGWIPFFGGGLVLFMVCLYLGYGNFFSQTFDWQKHNSVLQDLVRYRWPVLYNKYDHAMLTYYIGQYLFPALIGKLTHSIRLADVAMGLIGYLGIMLVYVNVLCISRADNSKKQLIILVLLLFFSGMMHQLQYLFYMICPELLVYPGTKVSSLGCFSTLYISNMHLEYRSIMTDLQWVYPQTIVPWLCTIMLYGNRDRCKYFGLLILPALITGTWEFLALALLAFGLMVYELIKRKGQCIKEILSVPNLFCAIFPGLIMMIYYLGNVGGETNASPIIDGMMPLSVYFSYCLPFVLFMFGFYFLIIMNYNKHDVLFWMMGGGLLLIPLVDGSDFIMCTSVPLFFLLFLYIIRFLFMETNKILKGLLILLLALGAISPIRQLKATVSQKPYDRFTEWTLLECTDRNNQNISNEMKYHYYTYDYEESMFYKYFAK